MDVDQKIKGGAWGDDEEAEDYLKQIGKTEEEIRPDAARFVKDHEGNCASCRRVDDI